MAEEALNIRGNEYYAMAKYLAVRCHKYQDAFLRCKAKYDHPSDCSTEGTALLKCTSEVYKQLQKEAPDQFKAYADCLDYQGLRITRCRDT
jgi:NADH dehydrogenase (ubiquinone) 1 alpha subcomplex subunit 8